MSSRRRFLAAGLALAVLAPAVAAAVKVDRVIDLRTESRAGSFALLFCSRKSAGAGADVGHAFVVWVAEDPERCFSSAEAFGYYPQRDDAVGIVQAVVGPVPGELRREIAEGRIVTSILEVKVDEAAYRASERARERWIAGHRYQLLISDCESFMMEVASSAGLKVPPRWAAPTPHAFLEQMISLNGATAPGPAGNGGGPGASDDSGKPGESKVPPPEAGADASAFWHDGNLNAVRVATQAGPVSFVANEALLTGKNREMVFGSPVARTLGGATALYHDGRRQKVAADTLEIMCLAPPPDVTDYTGELQRVFRSMGWGVDRVAVVTKYMDAFKANYWSSVTKGAALHNTLAKWLRSVSHGRVGARAVGAANLHSLGVWMEGLDAALMVNDATVGAMLRMALMSDLAQTRLEAVAPVLRQSPDPAVRNAVDEVSDRLTLDPSFFVAFYQEIQSRQTEILQHGSVWALKMGLMAAGVHGTLGVALVVETIFSDWNQQASAQAAVMAATLEAPVRHAATASSDPALRGHLGVAAAAARWLYFDRMTEVVSVWQGRWFDFLSQGHPYADARAYFGSMRDRYGHELSDAWRAENAAFRLTSCRELLEAAAKGQSITVNGNKGAQRIPDTDEDFEGATFLSSVDGKATLLLDFSVTPGVSSRYPYSYLLQCESDEGPVRLLAVLAGSSELTLDGGEVDMHDWWPIPDDTHCCPSIEVVKRYRVGNGAVRLVGIDVKPTGSADFYRQWKERVTDPAKIQRAAGEYMWMTYSENASGHMGGEWYVRSGRASGKVFHLLPSGGFYVTKEDEVEPLTFGLWALDKNGYLVLLFSFVEPIGRDCIGRAVSRTISGESNYIYQTSGWDAQGNWYQVEGDTTCIALKRQ